ncbi:MAG TPA: hypothetical protein VF819_07530 [Nitrospira sp.]
MAEKTPKLKLVCFDLPFVLNVGDSWKDEALEEWATAISEGKTPPLHVRHASPSGNNSTVHLPKVLVAPYEVALPGRVVQLATLRRVNQERAIKIFAEIPGDRAGKASLSSVRVLMDVSGMSNDKQWDAEFLCQIALDAVNHFIDHYRIIANRPFLGHVTLSVVQEFSLFTIFDDDSTQKQTYMHGSGSAWMFVSGLEGAKDATLRAAVAQLESPPILAILDSDIVDHLDLREWRLAVIQLAVLFEAWLSRFIRTRFAKSGLGSAAMEAKFVRSDGQPKSATAIAKGLVKEATGFDFATTTEYDNWAKDVRDLRNDLVHGKRFDVTESEAMGAYRAVHAAIALLQTV